MRRHYAQMTILVIAILLFMPQTVMGATDKTYFGEYPQTKVSKETNPLLYNDLIKMSAKDGDTIILEGERYLYYNYNYYRYDPISWIVLSGSNTKAMLISEYVLDNHSYGTVKDASIPWIDSDLRKWCNNDFINRAFTETEKNCIYLMAVDSCDGSTEKTISTSEKVSLPSHEQVEGFPKSVKQGVGTDYSGNGNHDYHTRCLESYYGVWDFPIYVTSDCDFDAFYSANWSRGVRPLISVNLDQAISAEKERNEEKEKAKAKDLSKAAITLSKTSYKYDGKAKKPSVSVTYNGKKLSTSDYSVAYKDNRYAGTASVEVTGKRNFKGTVKKTFTITAGKKIAITFNGNGGTVSKKTINVNMGGKYGTLPTAKFKGYKFLGWFTAKKGGKQITKTSYVEITKKQTLYARWKKETYTITYNLNGGTNSKKNPKSYTVTTKTFSFINPTRKGYIFKGWYTNSKLTKSIKNVPKGSKGNKTLYAKWSAISYSIEFDGNGVITGKMTSMNSLKYGLGYRLKKNTYKAPKGKQFKGWNTKKDGSGKSYKDQETITDLTTKNGGKIKLYAQWQLTRYEIKYVLNGGTNNSNNVKDFNISEKKEIKNGNRVGYTFAGWFVDADLTGKCITNTNQLPAKKVTLYAKWKPITYTVHFDANGWLRSIPKDILCQYDKNVTLPSISDSNFSHWSVGNDTNSKITNGAVVKNLRMSTGTVTLYAQKNSGSINVADSSLSEKGFSLLADLELSSNASDIKRDESGIITAIRTIDIGDGGVTIGYGYYVAYSNTDLQKWLKDKYGINASSPGEFVGVDICYELSKNEIKSKEAIVKNALLAKGVSEINQSTFDALVIQAYNCWTNKFLNYYLNDCLSDAQVIEGVLSVWYRNLSGWPSYGRGWTNRVTDQVECSRHGDYVRNH